LAAVHLPLPEDVPALFVNVTVPDIFAPAFDLGRIISLDRLAFSREFEAELGGVTGYSTADLLFANGGRYRYLSVYGRVAPTRRSVYRAPPPLSRSTENAHLPGNIGRT